MKEQSHDKITTCTNPLKQKRRTVEDSSDTRLHTTSTICSKSEPSPPLYSLWQSISTLT